MTQLRLIEALHIACGTCAAPPGVECRVSGGGKRSHPHARRYIDAATKEKAT